MNVNVCDLPPELMHLIMAYLPNHAMLQAMCASPRVFVVPPGDLKRRKWKILPFLKLAQWGDLEGFKYKYDQEVTVLKPVKEELALIEHGFKKCLEWASAEGHLPIVQFIQQHFPTIVSAQAMNWACQYGHLPVVQYLHHMGHTGTTKAASWASENGHLAVVQFLCGVGAPIDLNELNEAIKLAEKKGHLAIVNYFLK